jgi:hypothetical protein
MSDVSSTDEVDLVPGWRDIMQRWTVISVCLIGMCMLAPPRGVAAPSPDKPRVISVLIFGDVPTREYQFLRVLLRRQMDREQVRLTQFLQSHRGRTPITADVEAQGVLADFPGRLEDPEKDKDLKEEERLMNLRSHHVVIAFDPAWSKLSAAQRENLSKWVKEWGGALIVVAGPIHTFELARPQERDELKPVADLFPVELEDIRLHALDLDRRTPWRLSFPKTEEEVSFLKLDPDRRDSHAGWNEFFTGDKEPAEGAPVRRGFYSYYPVKKVKDGAVVVASYADPGAKLDGGKGAEQPYIVAMPAGRGTVVYLTSGEFWRLRELSEEYHERFWLNLINYAAK